MLVQNVGLFTILWWLTIPPRVTDTKQSRSSKFRGFFHRFSRDPGVPKDDTHAATAAVARTEADKQANSAAYYNENAQ